MAMLASRPQTYNGHLSSLGPYPMTGSLPAAIQKQLPQNNPPRSRSPQPPPPKPQQQQQHHYQQSRPRPPMQNRMSARPLPDPSTAFPSFTAGHSFSSEAHMQHSINWQAVTSRNLFEDPPTFQSVLIFLIPQLPSPAITSFVKSILNTPDHIIHLQKCWDILKRNDREELISFGLPERVGEMRLEIYRLSLMVRLAWRLVQALKNARGGSRISEVGEWVMYVIEMNKTVSPEKFDPIPLQTLACSLTYSHPSMSIDSKIKDSVTPLHRTERDKMALEYFELGFPANSQKSIFLPSTIYGKAHHARLLRRLGRHEEAEEIEGMIRNWWTRTGRAMMPKLRFADLVCLEGEDRFLNPILKGLDGFERRSDNGSNASASEGDSSSGRDSGVDVRPIHVPIPKIDIKPLPANPPMDEPQPQINPSPDGLKALNAGSPYGFNGSTDSLQSLGKGNSKFRNSIFRGLRKERSFS